MKNFLEKYNATKIENSKDEGMLTLEKAKERILNLLTENMRNFKNDSWDIKNRMNKLITDTENNSIFSLRLGGKRIARYSLDLLTTEQKINFLADFYTSVVEKEFDDDILNFLAQEVDNAAVRKKEANERVIVFYVSGSYLHFRNIEVVGTQVTIVGHTQSECFRNEGGSDNIYEHLSMHDGMAIGFYIVTGKNNLVLNCDAYNNYDPVSDGGKGGNVDGFGGHLTSPQYTGNVFRGCRAWYNSDDGFDLINCQAVFTIDNCWSFLNGYTKDGGKAGDGTGFKSGGYGMSDNPKAPSVIPMHIVQYCLAYMNKNKGFYANHHLGGIAWYNNTGYQNPSNFCMLNRKTASEAVDVPGYGHIIKNNLSHTPRSSGKHIIDVNQAECEIANNSFLPVDMAVTDDDFVSLDASQLALPRKSDGSLPYVEFLRLKTNSKLYNAGMGCFLTGGGEETSYDWLEDAAILVEGDVAKIVGHGAEAFVYFYINGKAVSFSDKQVDLSAYKGEIDLKATTDNGDVTKLKQIR